MVGLYLSVVQGKDLIADILLPPNYIVECYLVVPEMLAAGSGRDIEALAERLRSLRADCNKRHAVWQSERFEPALAEELRGQVKRFRLN